jgi:transcription initiation factor TFIIH subunit 1
MSPAPTDKNDMNFFREELTKDLLSRQAGTVTPNTAALALPAHMTNGSSNTSSRASSVDPARSGTTNLEVRRRVLNKMPELALLHRELVVGRQITEAEFWEGREHILIAEIAAAQQKRGKPSEIVDPRPAAGSDGELKISLSPQMITDIFEEFPIVRKAYNETVPTLRASSGDVISNQNFSTAIVRQRELMLRSQTLFLTNILSQRTTISYLAIHEKILSI